ncbi:MAG: hypothetical protein A3H98_14390 [Bacteroidetes bacterium RIFCSPLOWO2_02_FULL_36_8]|nr:MAG: hypothetical protein A3H98_14390 [Bacteroidetes bacterium RIFCSPLOWO2_02_FULL_36_8]
MHRLYELRPFVLTIGGLDPCGTSGIVADLKTFETNRVYGMAVCTAITCQNDISFSKIKWLSKTEIISQLKILLDRFKFESCKIGIIKDFKILLQIISILKKYNHKIKIVWDPILKSTSGHFVHKKFKEAEIKNICKKINLITPNPQEVSSIYPDKKNDVGACILSKYCPVLLKSSEVSSSYCNDLLIIGNNKIVIKGTYLKKFSKRGTGCVLSSAIVSNLAKGYSVANSCIIAKKYVRKYLRSNKSLMGFHSTGV